MANVLQHSCGNSSQGQKQTSQPKETEIGSREINSSACPCEEGCYCRLLGVKENEANGRERQINGSITTAPVSETMKLTSYRHAGAVEGKDESQVRWALSILTSHGSTPQITSTVESNLMHQNGLSHLETTVDIDEIQNWFQRVELRSRESRVATPDSMMNEPSTSGENSLANSTILGSRSDTPSYFLRGLIPWNELSFVPRHFLRPPLRLTAQSQFCLRSTSPASSQMNSWFGGYPESIPDEDLGLEMVVV